MNIIELRHCSVYRDKKILDDISLRIAPFEHTVILGRNGAGKSTLIRLIMREWHPAWQDQDFHIEILGRRDYSLFELRRAIALISPKLGEQLLQAGYLSVFDAVASAFFGTYGFFGEDKLSAEQQARAHAILDRLQLTFLQDRPIDTLSTGQLRKILIARAMLLEPALILLDEPTAGLDITSQHDFLHYLQQIASTTTILLVTHHLEDIIPAIKNVLLLKDGKIFGQGAKAEILTNDNLSKLFSAKINVDHLDDGTYAMRRQ